MRPLLGTIARALDPDRALQATMSSLIEATATRHAMDMGGDKYVPGQPLKLLLAGYVGSRNTGADVRVEEMIRQFRHVLGDDNIALTMMTQDDRLTAGYFRTARQVHMPAVFPRFLYEECPRHHGVVACEGSMFKSKFASALTCMMGGALGMAAAEGKISVGYGAEAGQMTDSLQRFVRRHCRHSLVICRNEPSRGVLEKLGIRTHSGTDTAWTFEPAAPEVGDALLRAQGWDGETPILAVCPINPFWWPVKPDIGKALAWKLGGQYKREHYKSLYFHRADADVDAKYAAYLDGLAEAVTAFLREKRMFVILVGMEQLDRRACEDLRGRLPVEAPLFISDTYDMYPLVSVLRRCRSMVSSRFHAVVTSMAGMVASAGVTMDERIRNLMNDRGTPELFLEVDDPDLGERLLGILRVLDSEGERIQEAIGRTYPRQLELMGQMGIDFEDEVLRIYPDFPRIDRPRTPEAYLPSLPPAVAALCERWA